MRSFQWILPVFLVLDVLDLNGCGSSDSDPGDGTELDSSVDDSAIVDSSSKPDSGTDAAKDSMSSDVAPDSTIADATDGGADTTVADVSDAHDALSDIFDARDAADASDASDTHDASSPDASDSSDAAEVAAACNTLTPAPYATYTDVAEDAPDPAGGTIVNGNYELADITTFVGTSGTSSGPFAGSYNSRIQIAGTSWQFVTQTKGLAAKNATETVTTSFTSLVFKKTCGSFVPDSSIPYTATATSLWYFDDSGTHTIRYTFAKR